MARSRGGGCRTSWGTWGAGGAAPLTRAVAAAELLLGLGRRST